MESVFGLLRLLFPTVFVWLRDVVHPTLLKDTWSVNSPFRRNKTHFWYTAQCPLLHGVKRFNNFRISPPSPSQFRHLNDQIQFYLQIQIILSSNDKFSSAFSVLHFFSSTQEFAHAICWCGNPTEIVAEQAFFTESILSLSEDNNGWYEVLIFWRGTSLK